VGMYQLVPSVRRRDFDLIHVNGGRHDVRNPRAPKRSPPGKAPGGLDLRK
jgi:hypothetical protein